MKDLCLVSTSGGLDSSLTLAVLKMAGYENIVACHYKYGHRGQDAEEIAIKSVCDKLDVQLKVFDIENLVTSIDSTSMLIDKNADITTGTKEGLKRLDAWVCFRNGFFVSIMAAFAESLVMKHDYDSVYLLGGFCNLSESGHYPDNSEYFLQTALEFFKYSTLIGDRFEPLYCLSNLMKSDQFLLIENFGLQDIFKHTISCDRPIVEGGIPKNCSKDGIPACGSGLLSYWASKMVGLDDMKLRNFYEVDDDKFVAHQPKHLQSGEYTQKDIYQVIDRILLPQDKLDNLKRTLG